MFLCVNAQKFPISIKKLCVLHAFLILCSALGLTNIPVQEHILSAATLKP